MNTTALITSVDQLVAGYASDVQRSGPVLPLTNLIARLRDSGSEPMFWARVGDAMMRAGFAEAAAAVISAGMQQHPGSAELQYARGNALRIGQRFEDAEADFRAALELAPGHRNAALSLAYMLREHGRIKAAADVLLAVGREQAGDSRFVLSLLECVRFEGAD